MTTWLPVAFAGGDSTHIAFSNAAIKELNQETTQSGRLSIASQEMCRAQFVNMKERSGAHFYGSLARLFARLRFYPLAMKCFLNSIEKTELATDSLYSSDVVPFTYDDSLKIIQNGSLRKNPPAKSFPAKVQSLIGPFSRSDTNSYCLPFPVRNV